ncbi:MAG TPA: NADPH-dependent 7-cyano-7-deazaguanine reductase QueF [Spirochaetota bacterium]|nr:NADPH-dependent 7-cyano-7-deazaguanine reductase QueF [Spirochaetota bacterium]HPJ37086.1 NADPH-dependent 7-cyano-7-deazaguanine reductase QueF [Spirochaetota bacterium]
MTDYSNAASAKTEKPENFVFDSIPVTSHNLVIEWVYPEFQSICPISERHDQGTVTISYKPKDKLLESKSAREYLRSWRNLKCWQEYVTEEIAEALWNAIEPEWLQIEIEWTSRGGIYARTRSTKGIEA